MTKDQRTIKQQAAQIDSLTDEVAKLKSDFEFASKLKEQYDKELSDMHATFDLLSVPKRVKGTYHDLTANARLTLFLAQLNNIKVEQSKEGD